MNSSNGLFDQDFLIKTAKDRRLTSGEQSVFLHVMAEKSIQEIASLLTIDGNGNEVTVAAVRQRLKAIYKKFLGETVEQGPGKLVKLHRMIVGLQTEQTLKMRRRLVHVIYFNESKNFATWLKSTVLCHDNLEVKNIEYSYFPEEDQNTKFLGNSDFILVCLADKSSFSRFFEIGLLLGRYPDSQLLKFSFSKSIHLSFITDNLPIEVIDATEREMIQELLTKMLNDSDRAKKWIASGWERWKPELDRISNTISKDDIDREIQPLKDDLEILKKNPLIINNQCFRQILIESFGMINRQFVENNKYCVPAVLYPNYILHLQKKTEVETIVKAIAPIRLSEHSWQREYFWNERLNEEIRDSSHQDSYRIFVFSTELDLKRYFDTIFSHANKYNVYLMSMRKLETGFPQKFWKDFSIIEMKNSGKIMAEYEGEGTEKKICFIASENKIREHEKILDKIKRTACKIDKGQSKDDELKRLVRQIFPRQFTSITMKSIEMSVYIDIEDYDRHEEKHAYFKEMMDGMIQTIIDFPEKIDRPLRILEVGAGTGIFTRRMLNQLMKSSFSDIELVVVEVDYVCFMKLKHNLKVFLECDPNINSDDGSAVYSLNNGKLTVTAINHDSCTYLKSPKSKDHMQGYFDCIASSFSDHHIRNESRRAYFENLKENLIKEGLFIVGDEFLREHDRESRSERNAALEVYHRHIIDKAEAEGHKELAKLEAAALKSGIDETGDFKTTCTNYERILEEARFKIDRSRSKKIGPKEIDDIGGVYVYVAEKIA
jgi:hypothetical protein